MELPVRIGLGLALPPLIAGAAFAAGWWRHRRDEASAPAPEGLRWLGGPAIGAAYLVGHGLALGWPAFPAEPATAWFFWLAGLAALVGALAGVRSAPRWLRAVVVAALLGLALALVLQPMLRYAWTTWDERGLRLGGFLLYGVALWWSLDALAERSPGASLPLSLGLVAVGIGVSLLSLDGVTKSAQMTLVVAGAVGAGGLVALKVPVLSYARGATPVVALLLGGHLLAAVVYVDLDPWSAGLLAAAPFAAWVTEIPALRHLRPWKAGLLRLVAVALPVAAAALWAFAQRPSPEVIAF